MQTRIDLPTGFQPEGIDIGAGDAFYVGSVATGDIYKGDIRTGQGAILVDAPAGLSAAGVEYDRGLIWAAGAGTGDAFVYDAMTGDEVASFDFADGATFINDVVVTNQAAFFTDSQNAVLYKVPISNGTPGATFETLQLTGDFQMAPGFNLNGIDATPDGSMLIAVQSNTGALYLIDPDTGVTQQIELANGESVPMGDGILFDGDTLYVLQNRLNVVTTIDLSSDLTFGIVASRTGSAGFDVPTTMDQDEAGRFLYAVNARFGVANPADAEYWITVIRKPSPTVQSPRSGSFVP
jgi:outer membrane protein assembly factor BamB